MTSSKMITSCERSETAMKRKSQVGFQSLKMVLKRKADKRKEFFAKNRVELIKKEESQKIKKVQNAIERLHDDKLKSVAALKKKIAEQILKCCDVLNEF